MTCNRQTPSSGNARGTCGVHAEMTRVSVYNLPIGRLNPEQDRGFIRKGARLLGHNIIVVAQQY
jgi:hypothetical protein